MTDFAAEDQARAEAFDRIEAQPFAAADLALTEAFGRTPAGAVNYDLTPPASTHVERQPDDQGTVTRAADGTLTITGGDRGARVTITLDLGRLEAVHDRLGLIERRSAIVITAMRTLRAAAGVLDAELAAIDAFDAEGIA